MARSPSKPVSGLTKLLVILFLVFGVVCVFAPLLLNAPIARGINKHFDDTIVVEKARLSIWPLRLELHDVHIKNPKGYATGDMMTIGEVKIDADLTNAQTVIIKSITYSEVSGYPDVVDNTDNFTAYKLYLKKKWDMIPTGVWRWPVVVEAVQVRNAWVGNDDPQTKLDDRNFDPQGSLQDPVSVQEAFIQSLDYVLTHQRNSLPKLILQKVKQKIGKAADAIGKALEDLSK